MNSPISSPSDRQTEYDVIIAGASFAGLAVANQLRRFRVLMIDRKPVGANQTSACGTIRPLPDQARISPEALHFWYLPQDVDGGIIRQDAVRPWVLDKYWGLTRSWGTGRDS